MKKPYRLTILFLLGTILSSLSASAQLQYFGYHASALDDDGLGKVKGYTNFSYISVTDNVYDPWLPSRVNAMSQRGVQAVIELGLLLWCDYDGSGRYGSLCWDWQTRWSNWKSFNAAILTPAKVVGLVVRDEPFNWDVIDQTDVAATWIKADLATQLPNVKFWLLEADCVIIGTCGQNPGAFDRYQGTLPSIDWIGINSYGVHPETSQTFQLALSKVKTRFASKKRIYNMDAWWSHIQEQAFGNINVMAQIAQEWYRVASNDPGAIALGVTTWIDGIEGGIGSRSFPCTILQEHVAIGRAITHKTRGSAPIGSFSIDSNGELSGWTCDPDQTVCEQNPQVNVYVDGTLTSSFPAPVNDTFTNLQCGTDTAFRFKLQLPRSSAERTVAARAADLDSAGAQIASSCAQTPSCSWTPHLQHFGYVGTGDDAQNRGLDETKGFTNFSHIASKADLTGADRYFVRDRVTAMAQRGLKATIDLGLVLWCGAPAYRNLCSDWVQRWETWKANNASILTSDKVLAFQILDGPFNRRVNMTDYETVAARIKTDFPWVKLWMIEAACVVYGDTCGLSPGAGAFAAYSGNLPNIDWIGLNAYAIRPATDNTYQRARTRMKQRFPGRKWIYVMDGFWDSAHIAAFGSNIFQMQNIANDWYSLARSDFDSILLGVFLWSPLSGATTSSNFPCTVLSTHRTIGREVTGKVRGRTQPPIGRLEDIFDGSGLAVGYACDPDGSICEDPQIDFYADGLIASSTLNYPSRNDYVINPQCGVGVAYRFRQNMSPWASGRNTTAFARDLDGGGATLPSNCAENPACLWFTTYAEAKGYGDSISSTGIAYGWVCDPDAPQLSSKVRLARGDGTSLGVFTTDQGNEQAVADECGGGFLHRFSVQLPASARGWDIHAFAQDFSGFEVEIPWLCDGGGYSCVWW